MTAASYRVLPLLIPFSLVGCEDRVDQCNQLVERLNPHTSAMVSGVENLARVESNPAAIDELLALVEAADRDLSTLALEDERLAGFALRYRRQLADAREAAEALRAASTASDAKALNAAAKKADGFLDGQTAILNELNSYCGPSES